MTIKVDHLAQADSIVLEMLKVSFSLEADEKHARWMKDPTILQRSKRAQLKTLIDQAHGNITVALELMVGKGLGNWGYGGDTWVNTWGAAPANKITITCGPLGDYDDRGNWHSNPPDYEVSWHCVLEYVAGMPIQGSLF